MKRNDELIGAGQFADGCVLDRIFESTMIHLKIHYFSMSLALVVLAALPLQAKDIVIATSSMTLTSVPLSRRN